MKTWKPTDVFLRGKIIKCFLPFEKYPNLNDNNLKNLYPGDEVYIFEVTCNYKWARGYVITVPFPHDFNFTSIEPDKVPTSNTAVSVFPMKCVQILEQIPLSSKFDSNSHIPRLLYMESSIKEAGKFALDASNSTKMRPLLPIKTCNKFEHLIEEMKDAIELLTSHIFTFYSIGDFHLFYDLLLIYYSLEELRLQLIHDILTSSEAKIAKDILIHLLNKIPKLLSSRDNQLSVLLNALNNDNTDISGYKALLTRDTSTGDLSNSNSIPLSIAFNQILCSVSSKYLIGVHLEKPKQTSNIQNRFSQKLLYDVLVDFKSLQVSSQSRESLGIIVYFYICYGEKRISETFAVRANNPSSINGLEEMNDALFKNIPFSEMNSEHVYLVAQVVEEIELSVNDSSRILQLAKIRKEVAVGVTDISKLFSSRESSDGSLLKIRLFGSYMDLMVGHEPDQVDRIINNRWGEMFDKIINGPETDIACNLKGEELIVFVRWFKHQPKEVACDGMLACIFSIRPINPYPLIDEHECLYLTVGKIVLLESTKKNDLLTLKVGAPGTSLIFANGNEDYKSDWQFLTIGTIDSIEETVRIAGFSLENVKEDEFIVLSLYVNGELTAEGSFLYKSGNRVISTDNKSCSIELASFSNASTIATVNISTSYIGKLFNVDMNVKKILQFEEFFEDGDVRIRQLSAWLIAFHQLGFCQLVSYFNELLKALFLIADISTKLPQSESQQNLKCFTFSAIVYLLDTVFNGNESYLYLIPMFTQKNPCLPPIGTFIIENISNNLLQTEITWTSTTTRVCRIVSILMSFAIKSMDNSSNFNEYFKALKKMCESGSYFLSLNSDFFVDYQVLFIDALDDILSCNLHVNDVEVTKLIVRLIDSIGIKGLGIDDVLYITNKVCISNKNSRTEKAHRIILSKLLLIHRLFDTKLVNIPAARTILFSKAIEWAMEVLQGQVDVSASRIACSVLNCVCTLVWRNLSEDNRNEDQICYSLSKLLPSISRAIIKYERFTRENGFYKPKTKFRLLFPRDTPFTEVPVDAIVGEEILVEILVELSTIFCFIARIGKKVGGVAGYDAILRTEVVLDFFDSSKYLLDDFRSKDLIDLIFGVNIIRRGKFIPRNKWLSLYSLLIEGCVVSLELIKPLLYSYFIPCFGSQKKFEIVLWGNFFKCLLQLAVVTPVSIEHLSKGPRKACYQITGEVRGRIAYILNESWDLLAADSDDKVFARFNISRLGGYQMKFINTQYCVLHDLMLFALQKNSECQTVAVKLLWSIMVLYFLEKNSIMDIERQCLLGFRDIYYNNVYKPSVFEQGKFIDGLKQTIRLDSAREGFEVFAKFIESTEEFLSILNEYSNIPIGSEFDEDRTLCELNINVYLKGVNKPELLNSLINMLYEKNVKNKNYIQAALNMELLASTYNWDQNIILPVSLKPKFHRQTSFERKETLLNIVAKNFIKGNNLERAADTYNELLKSYFLHTYDLKRFANIHTKLESLYLKMETSDKLSSSYFKVSYIGVGFPPNVNGKIQIYEGRPFEHIKSIQNSLLKLHPGAQIITDHWEALKLMQRSQIGKYLHVCAVEPMNKTFGRLTGATIGARKYTRNKDLRFFKLLRKLPGTTSVYNLWTEEVTYETKHRFPTILNKSEIRDIKVVKLSPLDNAIRAIVNKNNDLTQLEIMLINAFKEKIDYSSLLKDLRAFLVSAIFPVNGGVGQYRNFIYDDQYGEGSHNASQNLLKDAFDELCVSLNRCLRMHSKLITPDMKAFHDALSDLYNVNFQVEISKLNLSNDLSSPYNHMDYQSLMSSQFEKESSMVSSKSGVSSSKCDVSVSASSSSSRKLSTSIIKPLNWKKLRNKNSV